MNRQILPTNPIRQALTSGEMQKKKRNIPARPLLGALIKTIKQSPPVLRFSLIAHPLKRVQSPADSQWSFIHLVKNTLMMGDTEEHIQPGKGDGRLQSMRAWYSRALLRSLQDSESAFRMMLGMDMEDTEAMAAGSHIPTGNTMELTPCIAETTARALERLSESMQIQPAPGSFLSWGMVIELYLSMALLGFPKDLVRLTAVASRNWYGAPDFTCKHYDALYEDILERNPGKDSGLLPLLGKAGGETILTSVKKELLFEAFDFLRESCGL